MIDNSEKDVKISCIHYMIQFQEEQIKALLNSGNKINTISLCYIKKLGLKILQINIGAQKIASSILKIFEIMIANFQIKNKISRSKFF